MTAEGFPASLESGVVSSYQDGRPTGGGIGFLFVTTATDDLGPCLGILIRWDMGDLHALFTIESTDAVRALQDPIGAGDRIFPGLGQIASPAAVETAEVDNHAHAVLTIRHVEWMSRDQVVIRVASADRALEITVDRDAIRRALPSPS